MVVGPDRANVFLDKLFDNGKSEACSFWLRGHVWVEHLVERAFLESRPVVLDPDLHEIYAIDF